MAIASSKPSSKRSKALPPALKSEFLEAELPARSKNLLTSAASASLRWEGDAQVLELPSTHIFHRAAPRPHFPANFPSSVSATSSCFSFSCASLSKRGKSTAEAFHHELETSEGSPVQSVAGSVSPLCYASEQFPFDLAVDSDETDSDSDCYSDSDTESDLEIVTLAKPARKHSVSASLDNHLTISIAKSLLQTSIFGRAQGIVSPV